MIMLVIYFSGRGTKYHLLKLYSLIPFKNTVEVVPVRANWDIVIWKQETVGHDLATEQQ